MGVKLAPEEDDKAFACSSRGTVLGFFLDLDRWEMSISDTKLAKIMTDAFSILDNSDNVEVRTIQSFIGRITHCSRLFRHSKWERAFILSYSVSEQRHVKIGRDAISQVHWWMRSIQAYRTGTTIPHMREFFSWQDTVYIYTDAAGGGSGDVARGMGGCIWTDHATPTPFFVLPWPVNIRLDWRNKYGIRMGKKLTLLESTAVTTAVACFGDRLKNRDVVVMTDNIGVVWSHVKGTSRDLYTYTMSKACAFICQKMNINLRVEKVRRCSDKPALVADMLSKGKLHEAIDLMGAVEPPPYIPRTIAKWLSDPIPSRVLGHCILSEMCELRGWKCLPLDYELSEDLQRVKW